MIFFENVKGFTYAFNKRKREGVEPYSQKVINALEGLGYNVKPHVIDFANYGIPQRRKRFILVGIQKGFGNPDDFEQQLLVWNDENMATLKTSVD